MDDFDILWEDSKTSVGRYKSNNVFEGIYIQIVATDLTYESVWDCLKKSCVKMYTYYPVFEHEFLRMFPSIEGFDMLWTFISDTKSYDEYNDFYMLEELYMDIEYNAYQRSDFQL